MRMLFFVIHLLATVGCQSVHTSGDQCVPIAMWTLLESGDDGTAASTPHTRDRVASILRESGLHAIVDESGIQIQADEVQHAREVLLLDPRLADSGVVVLIAVPAGSGRRTGTGLEIPVSALGPAQFWGTSMMNNSPTP